MINLIKHEISDFKWYVANQSQYSIFLQIPMSDGLYTNSNMS